MVYIRWYLVNCHVQRVQNMYGKGGFGVFKAELRAAEVDPRFKIYLNLFAVFPKTLKLVVLEV